MTINGRKVRLKKNIRRVLVAIPTGALIALAIYCFIIMFFWMIGIDVL